VTYLIVRTAVIISATTTPDAISHEAQAIEGKSG